MRWNSLLAMLQSLQGWKLGLEKYAFDHPNEPFL